MIHTNHNDFGGNFLPIIEKEFADATNVSIASGYTSLDIIEKFYDNFLEVADKGGIPRLLLGMAFYEGLSLKKLTRLTELNDRLVVSNIDSGVYISYSQRYHGKIYHFQNGTGSNVYLGSSNFSLSGLKGNHECTAQVSDKLMKDSVLEYVDFLFSPKASAKIDKVSITIPGSKKHAKKISIDDLSKLRRYNPATVDLSVLPSISFPLNRIVENEKSNLNVYFGKGRWSRSTGKVLPRPWYEIELIANREINSNPLYPRGDFLAYTDDGYVIPMRTQGDNHKNIRSKESLQIFGMWLKGKLQKSGALTLLTPVTMDTLIEYGNDEIKFYKIRDGEYYIEF